MTKQLTRNSADKMILGVCSGVANYLNVDTVLIRLGFLLLTIFGNGSGILLYLLLAILMPENGDPVAKASVLDDEEIVIK